MSTGPKNHQTGLATGSSGPELEAATTIWSMDSDFLHNHVYSDQTHENGALHLLSSSSFTQDWTRLEQ